MNEYIAKYFLKTKKIYNDHLNNAEVVLQFFQREEDAILCGINQVIDILITNTNTNKYEIKYLEEGSKINAGEIVLQLKGPYSEFGIYEGIIDGILSRMTSIATNAYHIKKISNNKEVLFMADRSDLFINQPFDGYAASIGGLKDQVTDAQVSLHSGNTFGTMPHALIQMFEGDLNKALEAYHQTFPNDKMIALVDFHNDVITQSIEACKAFGSKIYGVRVDTSPVLIDKMFDKESNEYGVTSNQIKKLRQALDKIGSTKVKIIVSSGFNKSKIEFFEKTNTPVDIYGVGQALLTFRNLFTADAVEINGKKIAKAGRSYKENKNLKIFKQK